MSKKETRDELMFRLGTMPRGVDNTVEWLNDLAKRLEAERDQAIRERDKALSAISVYEQERDEALALLKQSDEQGTKAVSGWEQAIRERDEFYRLWQCAQAGEEAAQAERDEALAAVKQVRDALHRCQQWQGGATTQLMESKRLREQAIRERDEIKADYHNIICKCNTAEWERDEARAVAVEAISRIRSRGGGWADDLVKTHPWLREDPHE